MKALQTRSPIHIFIKSPGTDFTRGGISIWVSDTVNIDTTEIPDYQLTSTPINGIASFEISELIRSKNDYIFNDDFYEKRDTAKYVLVRCDTFVSPSFNLVRRRYNFLRIRDGYVQRVNDVTVKELPQIFDRLIPEDIEDWFQSSASIFPGVPGPFNNNDAVQKEITDFSNYTISTPLIKPLKTGTFSMYYRVDVNPNLEFRIFNNEILQSFVDIELDTKFVNFNNTGGSVDIIELNNDWNLLSISFNDNTPIDEIELFFTTFETEEIMNIDFLSFSLREGDNLQSNASELILQDNYEVFTDQSMSFMADKKFTTTDYVYITSDMLGLMDMPNQSKELDIPFGIQSLAYRDLELNNSIQQIKYNQVNECKHTPTKVSFINRFGVIQDLVFFKKREDTIQTNKESYKTNVLQSGEYYSHIGQYQVISKESERSVILNTGFYPEEFNTVFEQLQNSLHHWIDDEPVMLEGSSFNVKTRVNEKLINYTFDFKYSNEEINTI